MLTTTYLLDGRGGYPIGSLRLRGSTDTMVRSCLTWDQKAAQFGDLMQQYLREQWLERIEERAADLRHPMEKMADMAWKLEARMNQVAEDLWVQAQVQLD